MRFPSTMAGLIVCGLLTARASAEPAPYTPPQRAAELCDIGCFAYSMPTRTWLCGARSSGSGMVHEIGQRCSLQVLASASCADGGSACGPRWAYGVLEPYSATIVVADAVVYRDLHGHGDPHAAVVPLEAALRLAPSALSPVERPIELAPASKIAIPNSHAFLRLDEIAEPAQANPYHPDRTLPIVKRVELRVVCADQKPAREALVFLARQDHCGEHDHYAVQLSVDPSEVVLIEDESEGCTDYQVEQRRLHVIDVANACAPRKK